MSSIDERVVQMRFDNRQFEGGVQTSIKSLDNLKRGLNFDGATRGLNELERAGRSFSLSGLSASVDAIANKFTTLGIIGVTALANITNSAINTGKSIVSALTLDPIKMGYGEYETKMGSIQTILTNTASKGTTLQDVNKALEELNEYSDKTIYNFEEMTRNIGTFTAAGVDLKTSTMSIKGIANLAAGSGSSALQASTAMYQLSQALAAGKVSLMDWNSVVNAGMGGELFQKALEKTAKELGHGRDMSVSFRESLESGWITTKVLTNTLQKFADDASLVKAATQVKTFTQLYDTMKESVQSGWAQTWETIIGGKDESSEMLTSINNVFGEMIGKSADARNGMLSFWKANGGRAAMIQAVTNSFEALMSILKPVSDAYRAVFPATTGERLVAITKGINDFAAGLKIGDAATYNLRNTFKGVYALFDLLTQAIFTAGKAFFGLLNFLVPVGNAILSFTGSIGQFLFYIDDAAKQTNFFGNILTNLGDVIKNAAEVIGTAMTTIFKWLSGVGTISVDGISYFVDQVSERFAPLKMIGGFLGGILSVIGGILDKFTPLLVGLASIIGNALDKLRTSIANSINGGGDNSVFDILNAGLFATILLGIKKFMGSLSSITEGAGGVLKGVTDILDGVKGSLQAYQTQLKAGSLLKIASAIGILAVSLLLISTIDANKLSSALTAISTMFIELFISMALFEKLSGGGILTMSKLSIGMLGLSTAILILSGAMTKLAKLDWNGVAKGLVSVGVLMAELAAFMKVSNFSGLGISTGLGIIALAQAVNMLATAVYAFSELKPDALTQGLLGVGAVLAEIAIFVRMTGNAKSVITTAIGITILATSMLIFAQAISMMGNLSPDVIGKGLLTMAGALLIIAASVKLIPKSIVLVGPGLIAISTALVILSGALMVMGGMSWESVAKGIITLAGALTIITIAMNFMITALPGAAALLVVASALSILVPVLILLGTCSLVTIGTGLLALAGAFTVMGVAALILAPLIPVILGLSLAIALLGVGVLAAGAGCMVFAAGITALAAAGTAGAAAVTLIVSTIVSLIPFVLKTLAQGVIAFAKTIGEGAPIIGEAVVKVISATISSIITIIPMIADAGFKLIDALLNTISKNINKLVDTGAKLIISFIEGVASKVPELIQAGFDLVISFIEGLADALEGNKEKLVTAIQHLLIAMVDAGVLLITSSAKKMKDAGINLIEGLIEGIKSKIQSVADWGEKLAQAAIDSAKNTLGIKSPSRVFRDEVGAMIAAGTASGIRLHAKEAKDASEQMAKDVVDTAKEWIDERKYYNQISLEEELYIWEQIQDQYAQGTEERIKADKEAYRVKNDIYKQNYDNACKWIDNEKYYNRLSLEDELKTWTNMQQQYIEGSVEREKVDRELYRIQNEINNKKKESEQKVFDDAIKLIDDRKYYNKLSLMEELLAWQEIQRKYAEGTAEREKADREAYRVQKELNDKRKSIEDDYQSKVRSVNDKLKSDIQSLNDTYDQTLKSRTDSLYNAYGLFDKIQAQKPVSGKQLTSNLKGQITEFETWQQNLNDLSSKGVGSDFIDELKNMGQKSSAQIKALNQMSKPELDEYVSLWQTKHSEVKTEAVNELVGLKAETSAKIKELKAQASVDLSDLRQEWSNQMSLLNSTSEEQLTTLNVTYDTQVNNLTDDAKQKMVDLSASIKNIDWVGVGTAIIDGMIKGIKQKSEELARIAAETALAALQAAKDALGIESPSKEFAKLGMYSDIGFANGLTRFAGVVTSASTGIGESAIEALRVSISNISNIIDDNIDASPVIRPVLDLSNIESGGLLIDKMFSKTQGINVSSITNRIPNIPNISNGQQTNGVSQSGDKGTSITFTQNNYSPTPLSRIDIYRQTRNQISTMKGLVSN